MKAEHYDLKNNITHLIAYVCELLDNPDITEQEFTKLVKVKLHLQKVWRLLLI